MPPASEKRPPAKNDLRTKRCDLRGVPKLGWGSLFDYFLSFAAGALADHTFLPPSGAKNRLWLDRPLARPAAENQHFALGRRPRGR